MYLVDKQIVKKSTLSSDKEPDFLIFNVQGNIRHCYIVELKDGDSFDTKKSSGERKTLLEFQDSISKKMSFTVSIHMCCFNQSDKNKIINGFKKVFME